MRIEPIEPAVQGRQTELFVHGRLDADDILNQQGVSEPQGLDKLDDERWAGDEADERYLAALFGDA